MHGQIESHDACSDSKESQDAWSDSVKVRLLHVYGLHVADVVHIYIYISPSRQASIFRPTNTSNQHLNQMKETLKEKKK